MPDTLDVPTLRDSPTTIRCAGPGERWRGSEIMRRGNRFAEIQRRTSRLVSLAGTNRRGSAAMGAGGIYRRPNLDEQ